MSDIVLDILIVVALTIINGVFAMSEIAVVMARKSRLEQLAEQGSARARAALDLSLKPDHFLATVQVGITLIGILAGAFGGARLADPLAASIAVVPALAPYATGLAMGVVVLAITYLSLVVGELVPKRLALVDPERIAMGVAGIMGRFSRLVYPMVHVLSASTDFSLRAFGVEKRDEPSVTEEDVTSLIKEGARIGVFEAAEHNMVENVLALGDRTVSSIMTPRPEVVFLDVEDTWEESRAKVAESGHSRFPVVRGDLDTVLGVLRVKDVLTRWRPGSPFRIEDAIRPALFVPAGVKALQALELFKKSQVHVAIVADEYGVVQGILTLNDVLEAIVGDLPSPERPADPRAVQRDDGSWLLDAMLTTDEFKSVLNVTADLPGEGTGTFQTLGGFVLTCLGRIPTVADHFMWNGYRFEVVDMDGIRVDKVMVRPPAKTAVAEPNDKEKEEERAAEVAAE